MQGLLDDQGDSQRLENGFYLILGYADGFWRFCSCYDAVLNAAYVHACLPVPGMSMIFPGITGSSVHNLVLSPGKFGVFESF